MQKKNKFFISAIYTSPPTTMGGNTKIMLELVNNLIDKFDFVVFTTQPETFKISIKEFSKMKIIPIKYPYRLFSFFSHYSEVKYITDIYSKYFEKNIISQNDYFFSPSDFAPDVLPIYFLKDKYKFKWIPSSFLFIPNPIENLLNNYKFPFFKYIIYYFYQRYIFFKILQKADLFLITNDYDRRYFSNKFKEKIFAIYGGVNQEEIEQAKETWNHKKLYDAVFCSRLHPQKGISQLLEAWALVVKQTPKVKLAIIGNGEKAYEIYLKEKAKNLGIEKNLKWFGYVNGVEKYNIYLQSRIFLHSTIYDNNGMVAAEALCTGLPVIMYNLPQLKDLYTKGCFKVEIGNKEMYAEKITELLSNKYGNITVDSKLRKKLIENWNWKNRAESFYQFLKNEL